MNDYNNELKQQVAKFDQNDLYSLENIIKDYPSMPTKNIHLLFAGSALCGKSMTIKALMKEAQNHYYPIINHTPFASSNLSDKNDIAFYTFDDKIKYWEAPGLGQNIQKDELIIEKLKSLMKEQDNHNNAHYKIDLAIIVHNSSFSDWQNTYILCKELAETKRVILAINQKTAAPPYNDYKSCIPEKIKHLIDSSHIIYYDSKNKDSTKALYTSIITVVENAPETRFIYISERNRPYIIPKNGYYRTSKDFIQDLSGKLAFYTSSQIVVKICQIYEIYSDVQGFINSASLLSSDVGTTLKMKSVLHLLMILASYYIKTQS